MDIILDQPWTAERFLAWEDQQEGRHEFDGQRVIAMTGGSVAHQEIMFNLRLALGRLLAGGGFRALLEMRLQIGSRIRYPDVLVCAGPLDQAVRTLTDATAIFEIASEDTAVTDRVVKLADYTAVPSLRAYVLLEQTAIAATCYRRERGGALGSPWIATPHTEGDIDLPSLGIALPLAGLYQGLMF